MGAWGMQPKDNDGSGDLFDRVTWAAAGAMEKLYRAARPDSHARWERLGALQMFIEGMPAALDHLRSDVLRGAQDDIEVLLEDERWLKDWKYGGRNDVSAVKVNLRHFATKLRAIQAKR